MIDSLLSFYNKNKFRSILFVALLLRMMSAVFSTGYGMHDDHFITVEVAQSWIDGVNRDGWLPDKDKGYVEPSGHSLTYPSLLAGFFLTCEKVGIFDPGMKMFLLRMIHALLSFLCVYWAYKIIHKLYDEEAAVAAGWGMALFWMFPMLGVRNLVEVVCIPPLFASVWLIVKDNQWKNFLLGGLAAGVAFSIRFQTGFFIMGLGLAVLIQQGFFKALWFSVGTVLTIFLFQGIVDIYVWGYPFAELKGYVDYNIHHSGDYPNGPWYNYTLLVAGVFVPPLSFLLLFGFFKEWKKAMIIVLPVLLFFLFHSYFPNKQERFVLPVIPFFLVIGIAGWMQFKQGSAFWSRQKNLWKGIAGFAITLNMVLLLLLSFSSSKKNRVDAMRYLSQYRNISCIAVDNTNHESSVSMPKFYLNKQWPEIWSILKNSDLQIMKSEIDTGNRCKPSFVLLMEEENKDERLAKLNALFPHLTYETTIQPSFVDEVMHWLNPVNVNQVTLIYRVD